MWTTEIFLSYSVQYIRVHMWGTQPVLELEKILERGRESVLKICVPGNILRSTVYCNVKTCKFFHFNFF